MPAVYLQECIWRQNLLGLMNLNMFILSRLKKDIRLKNISETVDLSYKNNYVYNIGVGDQIAVTVWGLPDIFPVTNISPDQNLRRVDANGNIFFPYVGLVEAKGKTQDELRDNVTSRLSEYFTDPQVDVTIARFNSQQVFVLGEVTKPTKLNITDIFNKPLKCNRRIFWTEYQYISQHQGVYH